MSKKKQKVQIEDVALPVERAEAVMVSVSKLKANPYNPNYMSDREFELLCRSIEEDGFTQAILVQAPDAAYLPNVIVDGEHRWRAVKALGWKQIPVVYSNYDEASMKIATLRHNRARGTENISLTADVLRELDDLGKIPAAADSLMLDDTEISIMIENIPKPDITLRHAGDNLSIADINENLEIEKQTAREKFLEDKAAMLEENKSVAVTLKMTRTEKQLVMSALVDFMETKKDIAEAIYRLCQKYAKNRTAKKFMRNGDS